MTILSKIAQATSVVAVALWFHGCSKDDNNDPDDGNTEQIAAGNTDAPCVKMTSNCKANAKNPPTSGNACCQYFGDEPKIPPPGELGLDFPVADLKLSYFEIPACSAFQFHFHNHPEGLIMLEGDLFNPFVNGAAVAANDDSQPILAGSMMTVNEAQILPAYGGHTYVCTSTTGKCRWMSLWPENNFNTNFMFPPQKAGEFSADHRGAGKWAADGPPIIGGKALNLTADGVCNLTSAVTDTTIVAAAPSGFTLTADDGADPKVCFKAPGGNNDQYYATLTNLTKEMKTEDGCAYVVLKETVTWCLAPNDCSDMPALTFFYAGADGGSIKPKSSNGAQLYKACNSNCTDNNPWGALGSTFNLNLTESAAQNPQFDRVVKDICKNAAFADAEYVNCTAV